MRNKPLVSLVIPCKNSAKYLENCLISIKKQSYPNIEIIIVDSGSRDETQDLAARYKAKLFNYYPKVEKGMFDAPHKRNYGVKRSKGTYVFYVDADMELSKDVVKDAVSVLENGFDAVIVPENSFGEGPWAKAKNLERLCYWGDDTVEAPRFVRKSVWEKLGGLDEFIGGGGDDWDLFQKLIREGYKTARIQSVIMHNEGKLSLIKLMKKRYMYGKDSLKYIKKRPGAATLSYFPIRRSYLKNWKLFVSRPVDSFYFIIMRTAEYSAAAVGIIKSLLLQK